MVFSDSCLLTSEFLPPIVVRTLWCGLAPILFPLSPGLSAPGLPSNELESISKKKAPVRGDMKISRDSSEDGNEEYIERTYRARISPEGLISFRVTDGESDLFICAERDLSVQAKQALADVRKDITSYIQNDSKFADAMEPVKLLDGAPLVVREMAEAAGHFHVGPMAAVAGAVAQYVGTGLLRESAQVVVENGGDIFIAGSGDKKVSVYAGREAPSIEIVVSGKKEGLGICTSSARIGPSLSFGSADALTIISKTAAIADAAATAMCNKVGSVEDIDQIVQDASLSSFIDGIVVVIEGRIGIWGDLKLA